MYNIIFDNGLETIMIIIKKEKTIEELINEYFKKKEKSNLLIDNIENTYFIFNSKIIKDKDYKEKIESFLTNLSKIDVLHLEYKNQFINYKEISPIKLNVYTSVYKGQIQNKSNLIYVAIKKIHKERIKEDMMDDLCETEVTDIEFQPEIIKFNKEIKNMQLCHCENSVEIYDYFDTEKEFIIVMELCDDTLLHELAKTKNGFTVEKIKEILLQLNNVFKKMHENKIVHRDIKLNNILVKYLNKEKTKFKVLLSDYGISNQINSLSKNLKTYAGTQVIMAPEILSNSKKYGDKCDLWSLGIIIYRLKTKKIPYSGKKDNEILDDIREKGQSVLDVIKDDKLKDLLSKLLVINPEERISWDEYFNHPFFNSND